MSQYPTNDIEANGNKADQSNQAVANQNSNSTSFFCGPLRRSTLIIILTIFLIAVVILVAVPVGVMSGEFPSAFFLLTRPV